MRRNGRGLRRWGVGTQPIGQNLISKLGVGGIFNRAITSGMFQNAHRATIEWMAGEHHILFVCLSRFLTILLILLFVSVAKRRPTCGMKCQSMTKKRRQLNLSIVTQSDGMGTAHSQK